MGGGGGGGIFEAVNSTGPNIVNLVTAAWVKTSFLFKIISSI